MGSREKDIDEVLQTDTVFLNVSKGVVAKKEELVSCFGHDDTAKACLEILNKGELQVGAKERQHQTDQTFRDIATIVAEKCVNPLTNKAITAGLVERAMKEIHYSVKPGKSAKTQALSVIRLLQEKDAIPIKRAQMRLKVEAPKGAGRKIKELLAGIINSVEEESFEEFFTYVSEGGKRCPSGC